jgi:hypothetical protein
MFKNKTKTTRLDLFHKTKNEIKKRKQKELFVLSSYKDKNVGF